VEFGRRGRKRQLPVEDEYWGLILDGVGTVEACRQVGIGRKTGYRWRAERGGLPPLRLGEADRASRYLSQLERQRIATLRGRGRARVSLAGSGDRRLAHARARERGRRNRAGRLATDGQLRQVVQDKLELEWSPEDVKGQVRGTLHRYRSVTQEVARACADLTEATRGRRGGCVPTWAAMTGRRPG
jgi:transposase, IS30 family